MVTFDELSNWTNGRGMNRRRRIAAAKRLALTTCVSADEPPWTVDRLRRELRLSLDEAGVDIIDLLECWDQDGSGQLRKKEWLIHWKRVAATSDTLWYDRVRDAVTDAFEVIDIGKGGTLALSEIDRWMQPERAGNNASRVARVYIINNRRKQWSQLRSLALAGKREEARVMLAIEESKRVRQAPRPRYNMNIEEGW